jgi:tetratricopeptide (TPR) repeat protein
LFATAAAAQAPAQPADPEQEFLDALRQRKLYRLLENYCRKQLDRTDVTPPERARFTIELANTLATRAQEQTTTEGRGELWQQASALLRQFLVDNPEHAQTITLQFQLGVYELAQGELLRQQAKLGPQDAALVESARARLNAAAQSFRQTESKANEMLRKRVSSGPAPAGQPTQKQLLAVSNSGRYRLGQALLALAQTYPRNSADRTENASQAKAQFEPFTQRFGANEVTLESYLARAECLRLLGDATEATKTIRELQKGQPPDGYYDRSIVIQAQIQIDQGKPEAAYTFVTEARALLRSPSPEMDLLLVQATLQLARAKNQKKEDLAARELVAAAINEMDVIEKVHGVYWVGRCELLLAELAADDVLVADPRVLSRMADGQYRRGEREGTIATLARAVKLARERGDTDQTVDLAYRAASILYQDKQLDDAAEQFAIIASTFPTHKKAAQAQFMVAHCLGQAYAADRSAKRLAQYAQALEQHIRTFGSDATAAEARWLLGNLRMIERNWPAAIDLFTRIPRESKRQAAARQEIARAYETWLQDSWARSESAEKQVADAMLFMKQSLPTGRNDAYKPADVPIALRLARTETHVSVGLYLEAEAVLERVLFGSAADEAQRAEARRLYLVSLLGQDKFDAAGRMIASEFVGVPQELFAVVQSLEDAATRSTESRRRQIGQLQLAATERLAKDAAQLSPQQALQTEIFLAIAYVNAGEAQRAEDIFKKLQDRVPNDPRVLEAQAECFMQLGRHTQARDMWRQLIGLLRENTAPWYRAKYNLALACFHTGDVAQCQKIIQVTAVLHPELGGPELKLKFEALLAKSQGR